MTRTRLINAAAVFAMCGAVGFLFFHQTACSRFGLCLIEPGEPVVPRSAECNQRGPDWTWNEAAQNCERKP